MSAEVPVECPDENKSFTASDNNIKEEEDQETNQDEEELSKVENSDCESNVTTVETEIPEVPRPQELPKEINRSCDVNIADKNNITPLHQVFIKLNDSEVNDENDVESINLLLALGANVNAKSRLGYTALHYAVGENRAICVLEALIKGGADLNITDDKGCTALYYAVAPVSGKCAAEFEYRDIEVAKVLITNGAKIDTCDQNGRRTCTSLLVAAFCQRTELLKYMLDNINYECSLEAGLPWLHTIINWNNYSFHTDATFHSFNALFLGVYNRNIDMVNALIKSGASVNAVNNDKLTTLHLITQECTRSPEKLTCNKDTQLESATVSIAKSLIANGADVNIRDGQNNAGKTALHNAIQNDHEEIANYIIENATVIDFNTKDNAKGQTALHHALFCNHSIAKNLLLKPRDQIELDIQDCSGKTVLHYAVQQSPEIAKILIEKKCDVNIKDNLGKTALHYAVLDNQEMSRVLYTHGADANMTDVQGKTALHYALFGGMQPIIKLLLQKDTE